MMCMMKYDKVYVLSPAGGATGGTEALVTLCSVLRREGVEAVLYYVECNKGVDPKPGRFQRYDVPYVLEVDDNPRHALVVPEAFTRYLRRFSRVQKIIWWLSVDNYLNKLSFFGPRTVWQWMKNRALRFTAFTDPSVIHLCQSYYAMDFVAKKGAARRSFLMDFLGDEHLQGAFPLTDREDILLYNPVKGKSFTRKLMRYGGPDIKFVALAGMTPQKVHEWCLKAKVYIDFGNHPGKDRFPREAVMAGCLVITSLRGSAAFFEDVPIPAQYKFKDTKSQIPRILECIRHCLQDYQTRLPDFDGYRAEALQDKPRFIRQVKEIFTADV